MTINDEKDHFDIWPSVLVMFFTACVLFPQCIGDTFFLEFVIFIPTIILSIVLFLFFSLSFLWKRMYLKAISFVIPFCIPFLLFSPLNFLATCAHAELSVHFGVGLASNPLPSKPDSDGRVMYDWTFDFPGYSRSIFLVYDPTDKVSFLIPKEDFSITEKISGIDLDECRHLFYHYYECVRNYAEQ